MTAEQIRILLVEDDEDDYILTKEVVSQIRGGKFQLEWVQTFGRGLDLMAANQHDVYLVDYRLGALNGLDLLRSALARGCQSPVILLTGQGEREVDLAAMNAGAADYLVKAKLEPGLLERSIRYALERKRAAAIAAFEHARLAAFGAEVGSILARKESLPEILRGCAQAMTQYLNAAVAQIFTYNAEQKVLEPTQAAGTLADADDQLSITTSLLEIGILEQGKPVFVKEAAQHDRLGHQPWIDQEKIASFAAYPFVLEDRLIGVMAMFSQSPLAESVVNELASVANGIALCIERHKSKEALDASEVKYRAVVDNIKEVIFQMDAFGLWTFLNPAWEEMTGFKVGETLGTLFVEYIHHDDREHNRNVFIQLMERKVDFIRYETRYLTREGKIRWVDVYLQLLVEPGGEIRGVNGTLADITDRRDTEARIQKLAAFPRFNPNPVLEFSADGNLTYSNDAAQQLGRSLGKEDLISILPPNAGEIAKTCLEYGQNRLREEIVIDGKTIIWSFFPIIAGKVVHCYGADITDRLSLESQFRHAQKLESIGQLAAGIAHDFNNVLTVIQGHTDLILARDRNSEISPQLRLISAASQRAASLTRQLLMFSRKQVLQMKVVDLNTILRNLEKMLSRLLGEDIALEMNLHEGIAPIEADIGMIEQIVMNLAVNSRDAMPGGGRLTLTTSVAELEASNRAVSPENPPGRYLCLAVADTGSGMSKETLARIFEPFFTTKQVGKGTGLGLATAYGIVKQHHGWIDVTSEVGKGTTFKIFIPASVKKISSGETEIVQKDPGRGRGETILVVEDEEELRSLVKQTLKDYGYNVLEAANGVEALQVWDATLIPVDLLLTDVVMPLGMSGFDLAEQIRRRRPDVKVIFTSGYSAEISGSDIAASKKVFLAKPYSLQKLNRVVREYLDKNGAVVETAKS